MAHSKTSTTRCALHNCVVFEILHLCNNLWDFSSVWTQGLGRRPSPEGLRGEAPPAQKNYNWFYILQNCIIYDFRRILNSPTVFFLRYPLQWYKKRILWASCTTLWLLTRVVGFFEKTKNQWYFLKNQKKTVFFMFFFLIFLVFIGFNWFFHGFNWFLLVLLCFPYI